MYEPDDPAVALCPAHFLPWPCTVAEITEAAARMHADYLEMQQARRDAWAQAERRDQEAAALQPAAAAEMEIGVRAKWSRYLEGQRA